MSRWAGAVSVVWVMGLGLLAPAASLAPLPVRAQPADLVLCDRVAADPADPDKPAGVPGVREIAPSDIATAIKFCRVAAARSRRALYQLGRAYAANRRFAEAAGTWRRAADRGSTTAMVELGVMLALGSGVPKDVAGARALFERAAAAGNPRGVTNLAALSSATGAPANPGLTRAMLEKAAATNAPEAQYQLGMMIAEGIGGPKDDVAARALFERAAAQNHSGALERMGAFAQYGRGGPRDTTAARTFYERAVALGNEEAKAALERLRCRFVIGDKQGRPVTKLCF